VRLWTHSDLLSRPSSIDLRHHVGLLPLLVCCILLGFRILLLLHIDIFVSLFLIRVVSDDLLALAVGGGGGSGFLGLKEGEEKGKEVSSTEEGREGGKELDGRKKVEVSVLPRRRRQRSLEVSSPS